MSAPGSLYALRAFSILITQTTIEVRTRIVQTALALTVHEQRIGAYAEEIIMLLERNIFAAKIDGKLICK